MNLEITDGTGEHEVKRFIRAVRHRKEFVDIPLVFAIEAATNYTAVNKYVDDLADDVDEGGGLVKIPLRPYVMMAEYRTGVLHRKRAAVSIMGDIKWDMLDETRTAMRSGRIRIWHPSLFMTMGSHLNMKGEVTAFTPMRFFEHWREQFEGVEEVTKIPNDTDFGVIKSTLTKGMVGDDSVIAFMHAIYYGGEIFYRKRTNPDYQKLARIIRERSRMLLGT